MAYRNDLMPNVWAKKIAKTGSKKFKVTSNRVYILSAEQKAYPNRGNYFWDVSVDVQGQRLQYQLDISGDITKQPEIFSFMSGAKMSVLAAWVKQVINYALKYKPKQLLCVHLIIVMLQCLSV